MRLSEVLGHEKIKKVLKVSALENRVGHAYIFEGPKGVGRQSVALAFAELLLCESPKEGASCGFCKSCTMCRSGNHPDLQIVTNQLYDESKKTTDVLVDTIRSMKKDIFIKPYLADRKIYIVPKADTMNQYAQNSLLKVLEEPPEYCTIILIAENSNLFLPTILSRTVNLRFFPLSNSLVEEYMKKKYPDSSEKTVALSAMSGGCIGRAIELAESEGAVKMRDELFERISALTEKANRPVYDLVLFLKRNKDDAKTVFDLLQSLFRDLMYVKQAQTGELIVNSDKLSELEKISGRVFENSPVRMMEILLKYNDYLSKNISYAQIAQCMSLELWEAIHDRSYRSEI